MREKPMLKRATIRPAQPRPKVHEIGDGAHVIAAVHGDGKLRINWPQVEALASEAAPLASFDIMLDSVAAARVLARLLIVARSSAQDGLNAR